MAIPSFFTTSQGLALMRQNTTTSEWFFVAWVRDIKIIDDAPGNGTWRYELWLVLGSSAPDWLFADYFGRADLTVQSLYR
ncbi:hypothetical protein [Paracraurococcus ruber]|uniref:Uncharacterized protein n=1 Tax=Paracraurococcus ruber TaxID=77675 RepID=A0ABS1CS67_9PROT|nr:hypothetical protein [Paracraurococcus ruber]MBK1656837.1 hypothetical protein [Paracraurococcus ruber]TDG33952.1 hypothetical protein E2C05_01545 [Paracraurococcus ruber]